jgi:hypothetical protein
MTPPLPVYRPDGLRCPMVDFTATEKAGTLIMCTWHRRRRGKHSLARYRHHYRRAHWDPFIAGTKKLAINLRKDAHDD